MRKGQKISEETRSKISKAAKERFKKNPELWGKKRSKEAKLNMSKAAIRRFEDNPGSHPMQGRNHTEESRTKISKGQIKRFEDNPEIKFGLRDWVKNNSHPMKGKHHSEETKAKISKAHKGFKASEETKAKMSLTHIERNKYSQNPMKGKTQSKEARAKMSVARKGKIFSEEHKQNLSVSKTQWHKDNPDALRGENNWHWKGESNFSYDPIFGVGPYKDIFHAIDSDWECCNPNCSGECDTTTQYNRILHHIDHVVWNSAPNNLIPLCRRCNSVAEGLGTYHYYISLYTKMALERDNQEAWDFYNEYYEKNHFEFPETDFRQIKINEGPTYPVLAESILYNEGLSLLEAVNQ